MTAPKITPFGRALGAEMRQRREDRGWTVSTLSRAWQVGIDAIRAYERGAPLSLERFLQWCWILRAAPADVVRSLGVDFTELMRPSA